MSTTAPGPEAAEIRYGNLRKPKLPGIGSLPAIPSALLLLGALMMMLFIFVFNIYVGATWMLLVLVAVGPEMVPTADGQGRYAKWIGGWRFRRSRKAQKTALVQGLTGAVPDGECRLPGVAAQVEVSTHRDVHGREFGLVEWTKTDLYAVVIQCYPPGLSGLDKEVIDQQVASWAAWMGQLNTIGDVAGASVVVETAPDSGQRLARSIDRGRDGAAPGYSARLAEEMKSSSQSGSPVVSVRVAVTFNATVRNEFDGETRTSSREEMAAAIGDVLPTLTGSLSGTGAGTAAYPCTSQEITDFIRVAYDPGIAPLVEEARHEGGTGLTWDQAGPATAMNHFDHYQHETALSRTWQMREAPRGMIFSKTLQDLLAPHRDVARKRVVLVYRPEKPSRSAQIAENDVTAARLRASQNPRTRAEHRLAVEAAEKTAEQEALGSPLIRVGLLVTVTVLDAEDMDRASRVILATLAPQARLRMRLPRGAQDSAFVAALPLGMVSYHHIGLSGFVEGV